MTFVITLTFMVLSWFTGVTQECTGHGDTRAGCPADPAPWVCSRTGEHGARQCGCKLQCADEDGNGMQPSGETADCPRYCAPKKCTCHIEEECPGGARGQK